VITAPARRRGFTLVELLVVILLIATLAAISVGAFFRVQAAEKNRATESTLSKIETALNRKRSAVLDDAAKDAQNGSIPPLVVAFAGNDKDRARVLWTYIKLKNEFPTTLKEAQTDILLGGQVVLPHRRIFDPPTLPAWNNAAPGSEAVQSAACLYVALTATGNRGEVTGLDGLNQQTADVVIPGTGSSSGASSAKAFADAWGNPIAFVRMAFPDEVNGPPYTRGGVANMDPCDPLGKLTQGSGGWSAIQLNTFWTVIVTDHIRAGALPFPPATYPMPPNAQVRNWIMTTVSAGPDGDLSNFFDGDNLVGYRIRREGARGD
jgi:prepilin-type N-terminal cleavage/methylation domain-containing protein